MKKIILKKDEFSGFDTLIKLSDSIRCLYKKLAELEMLNREEQVFRIWVKWT